ncbi:MAG: T9SS type A sorting domain-containing protein [Bacteroidia bacterium]
MKKLLNISAAFFLLSCCLNAQSVDRFVIGSTGAAGENNSYQVEYTVGEAATSTLQNGSMSLYQGFLQTYPPVNTSVDEEMDSWQVALFPNPGKGQVQLRLRHPGHNRVHLEVWDVAGGRRISLNTSEVVFVDEKTAVLNLDNLAKGFYFLRLLDTNSQLLKALPLQLN